MRWVELLVTLSHHTHTSLARSWTTKPLRGHGGEVAPWRESRDKRTNAWASERLLRHSGGKSVPNLVILLGDSEILEWMVCVCVCVCVCVYVGVDQRREFGTHIYGSRMKWWWSCDTKKKLRLPGPKISTWNPLGNGDTIRWNMMYCSYFSRGRTGSFVYKTNVLQVGSVKGWLKIWSCFPWWSSQFKVRDWQENQPLSSSSVGVMLAGMATSRCWEKSLHHHIVHDFSCDSQQYFTS